VKTRLAITLVFCGCLSAQQPHASTDYCGICQRDSRGRIKRSGSARRAFRRTHPCPATGSTHGPCPNFVIDHIKALKHGGADDPSNMQWQSLAEAKTKDRTE